MTSFTSISTSGLQVSSFLCVFFFLVFSLVQAKSIPQNADNEEETHYQKCRAFIEKHDVEQPFVRSIVCDHTLQEPALEVLHLSHEIENVFTVSVCQNAGHDCDKTSTLRSGNRTCVQNPNQVIDASLNKINACFEELKEFKCFFENLSGSATRISLSTFLQNTGTTRLRERLVEVIEYKLPRVYGQIFGRSDDTQPFLERYSEKISDIVSGCQCSMDVFPATRDDGNCVDDESSFSSSSDEPSAFQILEDEGDIRDFIATGLREWNEIINALWKKLQCRDPQTNKQYLHCSSEPDIC